MSSPTFPHWNSPSAISVDNSTGPSKGDVYVADTSEGQITKFDSGGNQITSNFGTNGVLQAYPFKMTVSAFTG
jgi:DNA-binding beta-propeller fold protein YncE